MGLPGLPNIFKQHLPRACQASSSLVGGLWANHQIVSKTDALGHDSASEKALSQNMVWPTVFSEGVVERRRYGAFQPSFNNPIRRSRAFQASPNHPFQGYGALSEFLHEQFSVSPKQAHGAHFQALGHPKLFKQLLLRVLGLPGLIKQFFPRVWGLPSLFKQPPFPRAAKHHPAW